MSEFALIRELLSDLGAARADVLLGVGDDCALLAVPAGQCLAVTIDTLNAGVHFLPDCAPDAIGHKALAASLSDLAAMGAEPAWATLALSLPRADRPWLADCAAGLDALARRHGVRVVGGDTTRGPLSLTVQLHGFVPPALAVRRAGARPGDAIFVSGTLGDAGLALRRLRAGAHCDDALRARLERPTPRVALGRGLRGLASAMIDISDGLAADLGHLLAAAAVGAELELERLPLSPAVAAVVGRTGDWELPLTAGDDYELCFCAAPAAADAIAALAARLDCPIRAVGRIRAAPGLVCRRPDGGLQVPAAAGYDHFAGV